MKVGDTVRFSDPDVQKIWRVTENYGIVVAYRGYSPTETMVTAKFSEMVVHVSDKYLVIVGDSSVKNNP